MERLAIPKDYESALNLHDTQIAIKTVKDFFQGLLAQRLHLARVSAPLFVDPDTGLNDNLNGYERPVSFGIKEQDDKCAEVVHSLAKWKRYALKKYGFSQGEGIYTDMNAIRRDEDTDNIHSIFVDQWDWEKVMTKEQRTLDYLKETVRTVYKCVRKTEQYMAIMYDYIDLTLPKDIFFITTQELEDMYPDKTAKEREYLITKEHKTQSGIKVVGLTKEIFQSFLYKQKVKSEQEITQENRTQSKIAGRKLLLKRGMVAATNQEAQGQKKVTKEKNKGFWASVKNAIANAASSAGLPYGIGIPFAVAALAILAMAGVSGSGINLSALAGQSKEQKMAATQNANYEMK